MKHLSDLIRVEAGRNVVDSWPACVADISSVEIEPTSSRQMRTEYKTVLSVYQVFACNRAEYEFARRLAEDQLFHTLYANVIEQVMLAEQGVYAGNAKATLAALGRAKEMMRPKR